VLVKTALTVPTSLFVPMVLGVVWVVVRAVQRQVTALELVLLANAAMSILVLSQPNVPHFGGVKHWFPSMPFLAVLAAGVLLRGAEGLSGWLGAKVPALTPRAAFLALTALVSVPALIQSVRVYPYGTSAYAELAGGLPGAATLGMQRQFWANNVTGVLDWVNANARPGERIYFHEVHGGMIQDLQRNGMLRRDVQPIVDGMGCFMGTCPALADMVVYQYHQEFRETEFRTWEAFGTQKPVAGLYVDETPQVVVYAARPLGVPARSPDGREVRGRRRLRHVDDELAGDGGPGGRVPVRGPDGGLLLPHRRGMPTEPALQRAGLLPGPGGLRDQRRLPRHLAVLRHVGRRLRAPGPLHDGSPVRPRRGVRPRAVPHGLPHQR
jgi:hypothetical protein